MERERTGGHVGVDVGEVRIGVAIVDLPGGRARAYTTLQRGADAAADAAALAPIVAAVGATELVVGLPLDISGGEGSQAVATRAWAEAVAPILGLDVRYRDERHSSQRAEERLGRAKRGRSGGAPSPAQRRARRAAIDREAAAIILQDELDARESER